MRFWPSPKLRSQSTICRPGPEKTDASKDAVELDALPPAILRQLIKEAIEDHISARDIEVIRVAEKSERSILTRMSKRVADFVDHDA
jgi:hypothetical protein